MQRQAVSILKDCQCHRKQGSPQRGAVPLKWGHLESSSWRWSWGWGQGQQQEDILITALMVVGPETDKDGGRGEAGLAKAEGWEWGPQNVDVRGPEGLDRHACSSGSIRNCQRGWWPWRRVPGLNHLIKMSCELPYAQWHTRQFVCMCVC